MKQVRNLIRFNSLWCIIFAFLLIFSYYSYISSGHKHLRNSDNLFSIFLKNEFNLLKSSFEEVYSFFIYNKPKQEILEISISKGDTIMKLLLKNGVESKTAHKVVKSLSKLYDLKKLYLGQKLTLIFNKSFNFDIKNKENVIYFLECLKVNVDYYRDIEIINQKGEFIAKEVLIPLKKYAKKVSGTIGNSFIKSALSLGVSMDNAIELTKHYSYDIDFQRDIKSGDKINIIFEVYYNDKSQLSHDGKVLSSSLILGDKKLDLYYYQNSHGDSGYYSPEGNSVKKDLLKTPLNVAKISSGFGMRNHPVLGYSRMHKGIDFAASIGTPIFAAGSGVVEEIGYRGSYGNYVRIKHSNGYATAYAHASKFAKNLKKGSRVKQGEVIAYVGSTGRSTGPHLHYEVLVNNRHINPFRVKMSPGIKLTGKELRSFNEFKNKINKIASSLKEEMVIDDI